MRPVFPVSERATALERVAFASLGWLRHCSPISFASLACHFVTVLLVTWLRHRCLCFARLAAPLFSN
jgi:hypothetical protein